MPADLRLFGRAANLIYAIGEWASLSIAMNKEYVAREQFHRL